MIRDNIDVNKNFSTGMEYLFIPQVKSQSVREIWNFEEKSVKRKIITPLINTHDCRLAMKETFWVEPLLSQCIKYGFFLNGKRKFVQNSSEWRIQNVIHCLDCLEWVSDLKFEKCCLWCQVLNTSTLRGVSKWSFKNVLSYFMGPAVSFFSSYVCLAFSIFSQSYLTVLIFCKANNVLKCCLFVL